MITQAHLRKSFSMNCHKMAVTATSPLSSARRTVSPSGRCNRFNCVVDERSSLMSISSYRSSLWKPVSMRFMSSASGGSNENSNSSEIKSKSAEKNLKEAVSDMSEFLGKNPDFDPNFDEVRAAEARAEKESKTIAPEREPEPEVEIPEGEKMEFKAETRQLLDIVTNSLYTDKEVFLRELVSNASDSLEKLRHMQATNQIPMNDDDTPLEVRIDLDEVKSTITITDTGIGMSKDELIANLGTIARSGSKNFMKELKRDATGETTMDPARGIIGRFGVGFYSSFMVGEKVEVRSRSAMLGKTEAPQVWTSSGIGSYEIVDLPSEIRQVRGSSIVIHLKEEHWEFMDENKIETILKKYSNFVNFPIFLNGKKVNTLKAIWSQDPKDVKSDEYNAFYRYIAGAVDDPLDIYHFRADAPIDIKALFFIPSFHSEKYGMERMEPGVNLYSRKVLIESKSKDILPDWLRFVKGVIDSEDLPLSVSREKAQDTALITKLRKTVTRKIIAHLTKMSKKDPEKYMVEFYKEYGHFLKEGICQDHAFQSQLGKLLRYETSKDVDPNNPANDMVSLDEYISRMPPEQKEIYYISAPSREAALNSPYLEAFVKADVEVLVMYSHVDDFVMVNMEEYEGRNFVSAEESDIDLSELAKTKKKGDSDGNSDDNENPLTQAGRELTEKEVLEFCKWFKNELSDTRVNACIPTNRLSSSPAIVTDNESSAMRRMMRLVDTSDGNTAAEPLRPQNVEINPKHKIIVGLFDIHKTEPMLARLLAEQVLDNCLISAGVLDDSRTMLPRLNDLMICLVNSASSQVGNDASSVENDTERPEKDSAQTNDSDTIEQATFSEKKV